MAANHIRLKTPMLLLTVLAAVSLTGPPLCSAQGNQRRFVVDDAFGRENRPRAFAAPTGPNAVEVDGEKKTFFKVGGFRDGIQKAIFDETQKIVPPDFDDNQGGRQGFSTYDDTSFVNEGQEAPLWVPPPYRPDATPEDKATLTEPLNRPKPKPTEPPPPIDLPQPSNSNDLSPLQPSPEVAPVQTVPPAPPTVPPTTISPPVIAPRPTSRPLVSNDLLNRPPIPVRTTPGRLPDNFFATQTPPTTVRPRVQPVFPPLLPRRPFQPQITVPPPLPTPNMVPQQQNQLNFVPQNHNQQQSFVPQQHNFNQQQSFVPPPQNFVPQQQQFRPQQPQQQRPQQPQQPVFRPPPQLPQPVRTLRPFQPPARNNFVNQPQQQGGVDPGQLRTGVCHNTIFYQIVTAIPSELHQTFTHFAVVVSVDQCARTCHEFNCAAAFFDPATRHCQFNPSTVFSVPQDSCPRWPSPLFRNNVPSTGQPLKIFCITCQRRLRGAAPTTAAPRPTPNNRFFNNQLPPQNTRFFQPTTVIRSTTQNRFEPRVAAHTLVNTAARGVLLEQPRTKAINVEALAKQHRLDASDNDENVSLEEFSSARARTTIMPPTGGGDLTGNSAAKKGINAPNGEQPSVDSSAEFKRWKDSVVTSAENEGRIGARS